MSLVGYCRVSTADQDPQLQLDALAEAGADPVFQDKASGGRTDRPELAACLAYLRPKDVLVVWRLDRLGRSTQHLLSTLDDLRSRGVEFRSLTEGFDTSTSSGKLIFTIVAAFAEFERQVIRERTIAGLAAARARGRVGGRPSTITAARLREVRRMLADGRTIAEVSRVLGVSRASIYRALAAKPLPAQAA